MADQAITNAGIYDWPDADEEGDPLVAAERTAYERAVSHLRELILASDKGKRVAPGKALPGQTRLSRELGIDPNVINRAFGAIAAEGLARSPGQGKPTIVLIRHAYRVTVVIAPRKAGASADGVYEALSAARETDPLIGPVLVNVRDEETAVMLPVEMPDAAWAVTRAAAAIRNTIGGDWRIIGADATPAA